MKKYNKIQQYDEEAEQERGIEETERLMKRENKGIDKDFKEAEESLREALKEAERIALKQVQEEVDKLIDSTGVKIKATPAFVRRILSSIVKHVKGIYFISNTDIEEKINQQEITYEDCKRELRQCVLFNYWSLRSVASRFSAAAGLRTRVFARLAVREATSNGAAPGARRSRVRGPFGAPFVSRKFDAAKNRQVKKSYKLMGKNKISHR